MPILCRFAAFVPALLVIFSFGSARALGQFAPQQPAAQPASRDHTPRSMDADGIEELLNRVARVGGVARLPGGTYRINRTIRVEGLGPIRIEGEGYGYFFNPANPGFRSQPTRLLWTGNPGGTMFNFHGSMGQSFSEILFDGDGKAGCLVHFTSKPGWGTAYQRFTRVVFRGADIGLQFGVDAGDFNCADMVYDEITFVSCKTGLRVNNHQSVNHHFRSLNAYHTGTVLDFECGGNLNVDGWAGGNFDLLLRVGHGGVNAGTFRLVAGRPEMNGHTRRYARLLEADKVDNCDIIFEATQETQGLFDDKLPDNADDPVFRIGPNAILTVRNHYHIRPFLQNDGGVYRDIDSRWHIQPTDRGAAKLNAGQTEVTLPRNVKGQKLRQLQAAEE